MIETFDVFFGGLPRSPKKTERPETRKLRLLTSFNLHLSLGEGATHKVCGLLCIRH